MSAAPLAGSTADLLRAACVAAAAFYLPGVPLARRFARSAGGPLIAWLLPGALVVLLPLVWGVALAGGTLQAAATVVEGAALLAVVWALADAVRVARAGHALPAPRDEDGVRAVEGAVILACCAALAWSGGPLNLSYDSLDHLTQIRRSWLSGTLLPRDEFYRGGDGIGWDPRKGLLHPVHAILCLVAGVDPLALWRVLPAVLAPGLVLIWSRAMRAWCGGPGARADAALVVWVLVGFGSGLNWLSRSVYPNHVGYALAFLAIALWCEQLTRGPRAGRLFAIAALLFAAELIHLVPLVLVCVTLGAAGAAQLLGGRASRALLPRTVLAGVAAVAGAAAPVIWRVLVQGPAVSTLHTHPQGLLLLGGHWMTGSPLSALAECGLAGVAAVPVVFLAASMAPAALAAPLVGATLVPWLVVETPVFTVLYPALGYLLVRFLLVVPSAVVLTLALDAAREAFALRRRTLRACAAACAAVLALGVVVPAVRHVPGTVRTMRASARGPETPLASTPALQAIRALVAASPSRPPVVLADPFTSYALTGVTGAHVVSTLNQHGPPTDALWARRLDDQRDMLAAPVGAAHADSLLAAYGVEYVYINRALPVPEVAFGSQVDSVTTARAAARFAAEPDRFESVYAGSDGVIYRVHPAAGGLEHVDVVPAADRPAGARVLRFPGLRAEVVAPSALQRGSTARLVIRWTRTGPVNGQLPLWLHVRADRPVPSQWFAHPAWSKLARRVAERQAGALYRFRTDALPLHGLRTLSELPAGQAAADTVSFTVPAEAGPGRYALKLAVVAEPFVENLHLADILRDQDLYDGALVDSVDVR